MTMLAVAGIAVGCGLLWLVLRCRPIDERVEHGVAYGFKIGTLKRDAYVSIVREYLSNKDTWVIFPRENALEDRGPLRKVIAAELKAPEAWPQFESADLWVLTPAHREVDLIQLEFTRGYLERIYGHRNCLE